MSLTFTFVSQFTENRPESLWQLFLTFSDCHLSRLLPCTLWVKQAVTLLLVTNCIGCCFGAGAEAIAVDGDYSWMIYCWCGARTCEGCGWTDALLRLRCLLQRLQLMNGNHIGTESWVACNTNSGWSVHGILQKRSKEPQDWHRSWRNWKCTNWPVFNSLLRVLHWLIYCVSFERVYCLFVIEIYILKGIFYGILFYFYLICK